MTALTSGMSGNRRIAMPTALAASALMLSACAVGSSSDSTQASINGQGVIEQIPVAERTTLPTITGELLDGGQYDSEDHLGDVVVYNVWGSWCAPCREEAPTLRKVSNEYRDKGVQFVGINVRDNDAAARAFERQYKITYPSIITADSGAALLAFGPKLPPSAVPSTMIIDRDGRLTARVIGQVTYGTLTALLNETLSEDSKPRRATPPTGH